MLRVGAVAGGVAPVRARPRDGAAVRRGGLGGRHGRRAGRDGGGEPRLPRGRRALGRLRDRAAARADDERLHRPRARLRPLLRPQDDVREGGGGVLRLPRRLRHGRRAVRVAHADPDGKGDALPRRADGRGVLDAAARMGAPERARRRDGLARRSRAADPDGRSAGRARDGARRLPRRRRDSSPHAPEKADAQ